jgi:3-deoxy-manno-octulosonate cytidylyltransferase (CMP-KDO synthetase)
MIEHVHRVAVDSGAERVAIATDDERITAVCRAFGAEVVVTRPDHASGTDRLAEAASLLDLADDQVVVNLQGDEPLLPSQLLSEAAATLDGEQLAPMGTLATPVRDVHEAFDPNVVKVVHDGTGYALYFSRAPIPWDRERYGSQPAAPAAGTLRHLGIYAYRVGFLKTYPGLAAAPLERLESLEQLRALWHGYRIRLAEVTRTPGPGVDTPEDVDRVERALRSGPAL